jgi:hypothetical protein
MSTLSLQNLQGVVAAGNIITVSSGSVVYSPGSVIQVAHAYKTDTQTISASATFQDITGLTVTLTPKKISSKFLIQWSVVMGNGTDASHGYIRINRNGTVIGNADAASNRTPAAGLIVNTAVAGQTLPATGSFLDSPATTSAITYKLTSKSNESAAVTYINRSSRDTDLSGYDGRGTSYLLVMEIAV